MYRILSFDGGGIRGLLSLAILQRLEAQWPALLTNVDLIAGTSTGGIIALGLAAGKTIPDLITLYQNNGAKIFDRSWLKDIRDIDGITGADYDSAQLTSLLKNEFGSLTLGQLNKMVLIPSFNLDNQDPVSANRTWLPKFFHNFPGTDSDGNETVVDVALNTSAAPTYFSSHGSFIDGGVLANNPSFAAVAQTQDTRNACANPVLADICLLSIGTGTNLSYIQGKDLDWGLAQWAKPLISLLMDASMGIADYQCRRILNSNYCRVASTFPDGTNIKMDEWERSAELITLGNSAPLVDCADGRDIVQWLKEKNW